MDSLQCQLPIICKAGFSLAEGPAGGCPSTCSLEADNAVFILKTNCPIYQNENVFYLYSSSAQTKELVEEEDKSARHHL